MFPFSVPSWLERKNSSAEKSKHLFAFDCIIKIPYFHAVRNRNVVKVLIFLLFEKCVVGCSSYITCSSQNSSLRMVSRIQKLMFTIQIGILIIFTCKYINLLCHCAQMDSIPGVPNIYANMSEK